MSDDVTKKDLQNLHATFNAKFAELAKQVAELKKATSKDSDELDTIIVNVRRAVDKRVDDLTSVVKALAAKADK